MKKNAANSPIGIFDSGVGGLTVLKEIISILPSEDIVYFGDTARVPYGSKSSDTIKRYAIQDSNFLVSRSVKAIVVACNTVSSNAMQILRSGYDIPFIDVLEPNAAFAAEKTRNGRIGVIGTSATIESGAYERKLHSIDKSIRVFQQAAPLLVPLAEENWKDRSVIDAVLESYLKPLMRKNIDTLILGCTHYPVFEQRIRKICRGVRVINSARHTAFTVREILSGSGMLNTKNKKGHTDFYLSDIPRNFSLISRRFLKTDIPAIEKIDIESYQSIAVF